MKTKPIELKQSLLFCEKNLNKSDEKMHNILIAKRLMDIIDYYNCLIFLYNIY